MGNPWLEIPLDEYEGHMALPSVGQAPWLAAELTRAASDLAVMSVAVVGCAGGNGFDGLCDAGVSRIVGIDINPAYVEATRRRYAVRIPALELYVADVARGVPGCAPAELVVAALVLEYGDAALLLAGCRTLCVTGGTLIVVLQRPADGIDPVTPTPFASVQGLAAVMRLHAPEAVAADAEAAGFRQLDSRGVRLPTGKRFEVLSFRAV